jgi:hypothetical protein
MEIMEFWKLYKNGVEKEVEGWFYAGELHLKQFDKSI